MKLAILTSLDQWFCDYVEELSKKLGDIPIYYHHSEIKDAYEILFILSYHNKIDEKSLKKNSYNLVVHESDLPQGKGWSPLFWQILDGQNEVTVSMIEATDEIDSGPIYLQKTLTLSGYELNNEIRKKQAEITIDMCVEFVENFSSFKPIPQYGEESFYLKRNPEDSRLDVTRSIKDQFNLFRIVDNENYPAFFEIDDHRYLIKIEEVED